MRKVLLALLLALSFGLSAQNFDTNLEKYWNYRDRLTTDFMVVGDAAGKSLPALWRNDTLNYLGWSDNTVWQGWYMATLALEYHLLSNNYPGYDDGRANALDNTVEELALAIKAMIRLDKVAENGYYFPASCDTLGLIQNGFFVRDDVPDGFKPFFPDIDSIFGAYSSSDIFLKEMSQDQAYYVLMGLAMITKLVPDTLKYNGFAIRQEAIKEAKLIVEWMQKDNWIIKSAVCYDNGQLKNVLRGENATTFSKGLNDMYKYFTGGTPNFDAEVASLSNFLWPTLSSPTNPSYANLDNKHMVCAISSVGKAYGDSTYIVLMDLAADDQWYAFPLIHAILHDTSSMVNYASLKPVMNLTAYDMMNEAPTSFPYCTWPDMNNHGYASINRFMRSLDEQYQGVSFNENRSFNGLDYMALFNLYYVLNYNQWPRSTGIKENTSTQKIAIYPNPAKDDIRIVVEGNINELQVELLDIAGKRMLEEQFSSSSFSLSIPSYLGTGIYTLSIKGDTFVTTQKILIRK